MEGRVNNSRRKEIRKILVGVEKLKDELDLHAAEEQTGDEGSKELLKSREENWVSQVEDLHSEAESVRDDEQEFYDNMPDGLRSGDRGSASEAAIEKLEAAIQDLDELRNVEEVGQFCRLFHEKYDCLVDNFMNAAE
jgi:hypothetical protein